MICEPESKVYHYGGKSETEIKRIIYGQYSAGCNKKEII